MNAIGDSVRASRSPLVPPPPVPIRRGAVPVPPEEPSEIDRLRTILAGHATEQVTKLQERLDDPGHQARVVARVLPEALALRAHQDKLPLAAALDPLVDEVVERAVRRDAHSLVEGLVPLVGPLVRKSIAQSLRGLLESIDETLNLAFSWRAMGWRWEAWRSGRSFAEIVLRHTQIFRVEQVFFIHKETGLLLAHEALADIPVANREVISGMLRAIQDFVQDAFGVRGGGGLERFQVGELTVWVENGPFAVLAAVVRGKAPESLRTTLEETLESLHILCDHELRDFRGDGSRFTHASALLRQCFVSQTRTDRREPSAARPLLMMIAVVTGGLTWWMLMPPAGPSPWEEALADLRRTPGMVLVGSEGHDQITMLVDPLADSPDTVLKRHGFVPERIQRQYVPFESRDPVILERRVMRLLDPPEGVRVLLEGDLIRFEGMSDSDWIRRVREIAGQLPSGLRFDETSLNALASAVLEEENRWQLYVRRLRETPGIVVTETSHRGNFYHIAGLVDPLAVPPESFLADFGFSASQVVSQWKRFRSSDAELLLARLTRVLEPPQGVAIELRDGRVTFSGAAGCVWIESALQAQRYFAEELPWDTDSLRALGEPELAQLESAVEALRLYFPLGKSELLPHQDETELQLGMLAARLHAAATTLQRSPIFEVVAHCDSSGTEATNRGLSDARAAVVARRLQLAGIPRQAVRSLGLGSSQPAVPGDVEENHRWNRRGQVVVSWNETP